LAIIVIGGIIVWQNYSPAYPIEIDLTQATDSSGEVSQADQSQKIDINRAEAWLLEALPGIGETKAQAIIDYRRQHGDFSDITEITNVEGIGLSLYEQIKDLITIGD
jgi:competence protein ComEA